MKLLQNGFECRLRLMPEGIRYVIADGSEVSHDSDLSRIA
jgi:hypothetical protein